MVEYTLTRRHFLNGRLYQAGEIVDWSGPPSRHMVPIGEDADARTTSLANRQRGLPHNCQEDLGPVEVGPGQEPASAERQAPQREHDFFYRNRKSVG